MCRNIKPLYNFEPPASKSEISAASLQFVRKITGFAKPSAANTDAFEEATKQISKVVQQLFYELQTAAPAKNREHEAAKARLRSLKRFPK